MYTMTLRSWKRGGKRNTSSARALLNPSIMPTPGTRRRPALSVLGSLGIWGSVVVNTTASRRGECADPGQVLLPFHRRAQELGHLCSTCCHPCGRHVAVRRVSGSRRGLASHPTAVARTGIPMAMAATAGQGIASTQARSGISQR